MADVVIVGGGMAGASLAIALGRRGCRVDLFEAQTFPRDKPCGEGLMPSGVAALRRLGLDDDLGAPFQGVRYHTGSRVAVGRFPRDDGVEACGRGQRRLVLDQQLFARAAATNGVCAHAGTAVEGPLIESGRVIGVHVSGATRHAALVVAADGAHSRLRHRLGLNVPVPRSRIGVRRHFRLAGGRTAPPWVDIFLGDRHEFYVTPLPRGKVLVALLAEGDALHPPLEPRFDRWRTEPAALRELLDGAEPISDLIATPLAARARIGFVPGAVLLGDAAGFLDPITGGGMAQALVTSERLAEYIAADPAAPPERWLPSFERDRRRLLRDYRLLTRGVLALARRPALARLALAGLAHAPHLFTHLVGVSAGTRRLWALGSRL